MQASFHLVSKFVNIDYHRCMTTLDVTDISAVACCTPLVRETLTAADAEQLAHTLKALADPTRLRLLSIKDENARRFYPDLPVEYCADESELATGCDALVVVTDWPQYRQLDFADLKQRMRGQLVLDARNLLQPSQVRGAGLTYVGIGR